MLFLNVSCTQNDSNPLVASPNSSVSSDLIFPKKITTTYAGNLGNIVNTYTYDGNKILKSVYQNFTTSSTTTYTYTGDFITRKSSSSNSYTDFIYENGKLKSALTYGPSPQNGQLVIVLKTLFTYNPNGTISKQTFNVDANAGIEYLDTNGTQTFTLSNGNIIKQVIQSDTNSSTSTATYTYEYDLKNNPFKNVLGYNELIINGFDPATSPTAPTNKNLTKSFLEIVENFTSGQINSYTQTRTHQFIYNENGFVTEDKEFFDTSANSSGIFLKSTSTYTY